MGFCESRIVKVSVMVINLTQLANNLYLDLDCSGYHKNFIQQYCLKLWPADVAVSIEMYFFF